MIPSPLSPAHLAGLLPHSDYILGSPSGTLRGESALGELVEDHLNRSLVLWVYNSEFDVVREVELIPRRGWGGEGALGAVLGYGALHRLPVGIGEEVQAPGENLFDAERKSTDKLYNGAGEDSFQQAPPPVAPPPMVNPNLPPPPMLNPHATPQAAPPSRTQKGKHHGALSPNAGFEDMFAEGQKKSAEQDDHAASRKGTPLAPPPKLGSAPITPHTADGESQDPMDTAGEDLGEPGDAEEA
jgi:GRASP55/65 PDZ-like domain